MTVQDGRSKSQDFDSESIIHNNEKIDGDRWESKDGCNKHYKLNRGILRILIKTDSKRLRAAITLVTFLVLE